MSATTKPGADEVLRRAVPATSILMTSEGLRVPLPLDFEAFRAWTHSDDFPEKGRIDFLDGEIDIDMCPEEYWTHGSPKTAITVRLYRIIVEERGAGSVLTDSARISAPQASVSAEPDVIVLLRESVASGRVRLVPKSGAVDGRCVEAEGPVDLVVECVSDSSVKKDTERLRSLYHRAGVPEYWIADARGTPCRLTILRCTERGYEETPRDADGFIASPLLGRAFRLVRETAELPFATYRLEERLPATPPAGS